MTGETLKQRLYSELRHIVLNDLQVVLGAAQLGKPDAELVSYIDRALARLEDARARLTTEEDSNHVCR